MKLKHGILLNTSVSFILTILVVFAFLRHPDLLSVSGVIDYRLFFVLIVLAFIICCLIVLSAHAILKKMRILNAWTEAVLKGNLDQTMDDVSSNDEIGLLSQSLGRMLREIKTAYASIHKESLDYKQQSDKYKKLAEASRSGAKQLSEALARMKESHEEVLQTERLKALEQTVRNIAHDISESIVPIFSITEILLKYPNRMKDADEIHSSIETIHEAVLQTRKNIRLLADFFDTAPADKVPVDVNDAVRQAIKLVGKYTSADSDAHSAPISIESYLDFVPLVGGNEIEIQDSIVNLLINAIEAMPKGGTIKVFSRVTGNKVKILCEDTGKGMSEDVKTHCIEPFYTTKQRVGAGLGLTNAYVVARRYGGNLEVESIPGHRTKVSMSFHVWQEEPGVDVGGSSDADKDSLKILVTDDDPLTCACISRLLEVNGFKVDTASTAAEGLDKIRNGDFNFAIVDRAMAGMSGDEMALRIKAFDNQMPVLMLTGFGAIMNKEDSLPPGVDLVVAKPVSGDELYDAVSKTLSLATKPAGQKSGESERPHGTDVKWLD